MIAKGDTASLRQNSIPSLAADFSSVESAVKDNQPALAGVQGTLVRPFCWRHKGGSLSRVRSFSAAFSAAMDRPPTAQLFFSTILRRENMASSFSMRRRPKGAYTVSLILQQQGSDWKLGGLYIKAGQSGGHDSDWYIARARDFQGKGKCTMRGSIIWWRAPWFRLLPFMSTAATDKLYDESQKLQPADFPADGKTIDLSCRHLDRPTSSRRFFPKSWATIWI